MKKKYITVKGIKVEIKPFVMPPDTDYFRRVAYLLAGKIKPENESDRLILKQAAQIAKEGGIVEIPFD